MDETVVRIENVSKRYHLGTGGGSYGRFTHAAVNRIRSWVGRAPELDPGQDETFYALEDISLDVKDGDVLGIVGRNGAGKTTLLKLLARITEPTTGRIELHGRVGALLEVGTGFHPELTGRENVYLNGGILGMKRSEIAARFDEIVEYSGVERFLDTPVKRYSSGMHVRLAFAVAAHLDPEIMIIDEVLSVGDAAFQKKCLGTMEDAARGGRTVLFVSHNIGSVAELCSRAILLEKGKKIADGPTAEVLSKYSELITAGTEQIVRLDPDHSLPVSITEISVTDANGVGRSNMDLDDGMAVKVVYEVNRDTENHQIAVTISRNMIPVVSTFDTDDEPDIPLREPGRYEAVLRLPPRFLKAGVYTVGVASGDQEVLMQNVDPALTFEIEERSENTHQKGYRQERPGHVISQGTWETRMVEEPEALRVTG